MNLKNALPIPELDGMLNKIYGKLNNCHHIVCKLCGFSSEENRSNGLIITEEIFMTGEKTVKRNYETYSKVSNTFKQLDYLIKEDNTFVYLNIKPIPIVVIENGSFNIKCEISGITLGEIARIVDTGYLVDSIYMNGLTSISITCYRPEVQPLYTEPPVIDEKLLDTYWQWPLSVTDLDLPLVPYFVGSYIGGHEVSYSNEIKDILKNMDILDNKEEDKFIPDGYLVASEKQRIELLHGYSGADLTDDISEVEITACNSKLATQLFFVVDSLGWSCRYEPASENYWKIFFTPKKNEEKTNEYLETGVGIDGVPLKTEIYPAEPTDKIRATLEDMTSTITVDENNKVVKPKEASSSRLAKLMSKTSAYMSAPLTEADTVVNNHPYESDVPVIHPEEYVSEESNLKAQKEVFASMDKKKDDLAKLAEAALAMPEEMDQKHEDLDKDVEFES